MNDAEKLQKLKELLLHEDRDFAAKIFDKLDKLENTIYNDSHFSKKVNPIIDKKIAAFVEEFPSKLGPTITEALSGQIKNSEAKVVEALFPIIGKMIKKYIRQEIKILADNINGQVQNTLSVVYWQRRFKSVFTGVSQEKIILSSVDQPVIEQLFIIEKGSGLVISSFSKTETIDPDMVAGMLTAIKSFVEDAFQGGNQILENIKYELYTIILQDFSSYYVAAIVSGVYSNKFESELEDRLIDFGSIINDNIDNTAVIDKQLKAFFNE